MSPPVTAHRCHLQRSRTGSHIIVRASRGCPRTTTVLLASKTAYTSRWTPGSNARNGIGSPRPSSTLCAALQDGRLPMEKSTKERQARAWARP